MVQALVTGAETFLGGNLVRALAQAGTTVRALIPEGATPKALEDLDDRVELFEGDIAIKAHADSASLGVQQIYHCAASALLWRRLEPAMRRTNLRGTRNICDAAHHSPTLDRLVHASSIDAVGVAEGDTLPDEGSVWNMEDLQIPCAESIYDAELIVREYISDGLDAVIVNPTYMLGPFDALPSSGRLILAVAHNRLRVFPKHGGTNFVDVRDVAIAMIACASIGDRGARYILGGENHSYHDVLDLIADVTGSKPPSFVLPKPLAIAAGALGDVWGGLTGREPPVSLSEARFAYLDRYCNTDRARDELDMPHRPLRVTIEDAWAWFEDNGYG